MGELPGLKQSLMRERQQLETHATTGERPCSSPACERHFSVAEVAKMWNLSPDAVRKLFEREPGVCRHCQRDGQAGQEHEAISDTADTGKRRRAGAPEALQCRCLKFSKRSRP